MARSSPTSFDTQLQRATDEFKKAFERSPTHAAVAPGRVNLIGEHTDYNDGFVLPMAIERHTLMLAHPREDGQARVHSTGEEAPATFDVDDKLTPGEPAWSNYVRGVVAGFLNQGVNPGGFEALVDSTVPLGGGLSSSAALEVATATLLEQLTGQTLDPTNKALLCQQAEHTFAGMPCGIMDQFISTMGQAGAALLIDCRTQQAEAVPMDDPSVAVLIVNSNVKHELVGGEYAERREQCEAAAKAMDVAALRDADMAMLDDAKQRGAIDAQAYRRARHVISENQRTLDAAAAMRQNDWATFGRLMGQSHASMRDDFEISCPEIDALVELAQQHMADGAVYGSRLTGGGFGGCTVTLVQAEAAERVGDQIAAAYRQRVGVEPSLFVTRPAAGARVIEL
jgi:galactokinase